MGLSIFFAGHQDVGGGSVRLRSSLAALQSVCRLQLIRQAALRRRLVPSVLPADGLHEQRHQPHSLQRYVREVPAGIPPSALLRQERR